MTGFSITNNNGITIRFRYYLNDAPVSCAAFHALLPFSRTLMHARVSGQEIWTDDAPPLDIIQENATVFTEPGEVVLGPIRPRRVKTCGAIGIYYGEGRGLDAANVFAKVFEEDAQLLKDAGLNIWKQGVREYHFEAL